MYKYLIFLVPLLVLFFSACSTKEVYKPKKVSGEWRHYAPMDSEIIDRSSNIALLENQKVLTKNGELNVTIGKNQRVISLSDGWVLSSSIDGNLTLTSQNNNSIRKDFQLKNTIASASVNGDMLAVLFADDEIALYDIPSKSLLFKEQSGASVASDMRIVNPYFMKGLVIFATLDGKIIIVSTKMKKELRTVIVSSADYFNNIIDLNLFDNKIVASTDTKMLSLTKKELRQKYEIRNIAYGKKEIFITTKQGEVIALTPDLQVISKVKFPFAHFLGLINKGDKLYALEKEGYLIVINKETFDYKVKKVDIDEGFVFTGKDLFYVDDKEIVIK
ncbi:hypothetical protein [Sulfurimonas sp.]|uniref:hypothetical protein n=1 Tax=Sulfurimonas sp. TaxID=2022749 RepID=UPI002630AA75|nr:hypothetical protein [Sulfurimonas sp.]